MRPRAVVLDHSFIPESREIALGLLGRGYDVTLHTSLQCREHALAFGRLAQVRLGIASSVVGWARKRQIPQRWEAIPTRNWLFPDLVQQTAGRIEGLRRPGFLLIHLGYDLVAAAAAIPSASLVLTRQYSGLHALRQAQRASVCSVLLTTTPDPREEDRLVSEEEERIGLPHRQVSRFDDLVWRRGAAERVLADGILSSSSFAAASLVRAGIGSEKIKVLQRTYEVPTTRDRLPQRDDIINVLFAGQLLPRKGVHHLIAAVNQLVAQGHHLRLDLVGRAPEARYVKLLLGMAGPSVTFVGPVSKSQLHQMYRACDIFVLPTLSDAFGMVVVEAQAVGTPVIVTDRCGATVRDGVDGLVVAAGNTDALADALARLAADPDLRRSLGDAGRRRLEAWNWSAYRREAIDWIISLQATARQSTHVGSRHRR